METLYWKGSEVAHDPGLTPSAVASTQHTLLQLTGDLQTLSSEGNEPP